MIESEFEATTDSAGDAFELTLHQMSAAIAESQAALLAGRVRDLEISTRKQQELRERFELLGRLMASENGPAPWDKRTVLSSQVLVFAQRVHAHNLVFAGILERMRRNLEALQRQIQGSAFSYSDHRSSAFSGDAANAARNPRV